MAWRKTQARAACTPRTALGAQVIRRDWASRAREGVEVQEEIHLLLFVALGATIGRFVLDAGLSGEAPVPRAVGRAAKR